MLLYAFTLKTSATAIIAKNAASDHKISVFFGRYFGSSKANRIHDANIISIIILKAKFFPVMNGKSKSGKKKAVKDSPPATITGIKRIKNKPYIVNILKNFAIKIFFYCSRNELEDLEFGR